MVWGIVLLGTGLGGFFDGIVLHQVLQWHHMLTSAGYPPTSVHNLQVNTLWDGLFHVGTFVLTATGLALVWSGTRQPHVRLSTRLLVGGLLTGWGTFNLVEGLIDHQILGIHHVRTGPQQLLWDLGYLAWGAAMLLGGLALMRSGDRKTASGAGSTGGTLT
ncbi:MAG: DUF2243 domain-containing protein [Chloroflexota bacterium]|nr:DUF2243 domain-containing protein [Chloroflexota bacterium]